MPKKIKVTSKRLPRIRVTSQMPELIGQAEFAMMLGAEKIVGEIPRTFRERPGSGRSSSLAKLKS